MKPLANISAPKPPVAPFGEVDVPEGEPLVFLGEGINADT